MKTVLALVSILLTSSAWADEPKPGSGFIEVTPQMLEFRYQPAEDSGVPCTHGIENPMSGEWKVRCRYFSQTKTFSVHLRVRQMYRAAKPATWFELLYWVSRDRPKPEVTSEFTGTTLNFMVSQEADLHSFQVGQQVENGYADLAMTFDPWAN